MKEDIIEILFKRPIEDRQDAEDTSNEILALFNASFKDAELKAFAEKCNNHYNGGCGTVDEFIDKVNNASE